MAAGRAFRPVLFLILSLASYHTAATAQEFRIETDVFIGNEEESSSHTVTLFEKSAVYEFIDEPAQIVVYRSDAEGRPAQFIILDPDARRRTDVDVERMQKLMEKLSHWAGEQKDPALKFAAAPQFEETFDKVSGSLNLVNPQWSYHTATVHAENKEALARYRDFTDRYAELGTMLHSSPPPGPRLALNAALAKHGVVPTEIRRTTGGENKNQIVATHIFLWRLSREDRARIDEVQNFIATFEKVDNKTFLAGRNEKTKDVVRGQSN